LKEELAAGREHEGSGGHDGWISAAQSLTSTSCVEGVGGALKWTLQSQNLGKDVSALM
jgi:hypothetical protein